MKNFGLITLLIASLTACGLETTRDYKRLDRKDERRYRNGSIIGGTESSGYTLYSTRDASK